jgi:hypothetical protein
MFSYLFPKKKEKGKKEKRKPLFRCAAEVSRFLRYFFVPRE